MMRSTLASMPTSTETSMSTSTETGTAISMVTMVTNTATRLHPSTQPRSLARASTALSLRMARVAKVAKASPSTLRRLLPRRVTRRLTRKIHLRTPSQSKN